MRSVMPFFITIFMISLVFASPKITFQNDEIQAGETIFGEIKIDGGKFEQEILMSNIKFFEGRREKYFDYDFTFFNDTYYFYIYAKEDGEFYFEARNILYRKDGQLSSDTLRKNFNVSTIFHNDTENNVTYKEILSIRPGFIYYPNNKNIRLFNIGESLLELEANSEKFSLKPGETREIEIIPQSKFSLFEITSYKDFVVPVIHITFESRFEPTIKKSDLRISPDFLLVELISKEKKSKVLEIFNFGDNNITDVEITSDIKFLKLPRGFDDLAGREIRNLTIEFDANEPGNFEGFINFTFSYMGKDSSTEIPLNIFVLPEGSSEDDFGEIYDAQGGDLECVEPYGRTCEYNEICSERRRWDKNGVYCCFAKCILDEEKSSGSGYGWLIAILILAGIFGYGYYAYKKQKGIGRKTKPGDKIKESAQNFEKRIKTKSENSRVSGSLTKS